MKKIIFILYVLFFTLSLFHGEDITIGHVDQYAWEATVENGAYGPTHSYYFFDFIPWSDKVSITIKDIRLSEIDTLDLRYQESSGEYPQNIILYHDDVEEPLFTIMYGDNYEILLSAAGSSGLTVLSFETVKEDYELLELQGIQNYDRVRLRTAPNLESQKIGSLMKGDILSIQNRSSLRMTINDMQAFWFKVKTEEGIVGWTYGYFMNLGHVLFSEDDVVVFKKGLSLDQGSNNFLMFYWNNEMVFESGWIPSNKVISFDEERRIILAMINANGEFHHDQSHYGVDRRVNIFNLQGEMTSFEISEWVFQVEKVNKAPLFYTLEAHNFDSPDNKAGYKCIIYDLEGTVVQEIIYYDRHSTLSVEYEGILYKFDAI